MMNKYLYESPDGEQVEAVWIACELDSGFDLAMADMPGDPYHGTVLTVHWDCEKTLLNEPISEDLLVDWEPPENAFIGKPDPITY